MVVGGLVADIVRQPSVLAMSYFFAENVPSEFVSV